MPRVVASGFEMWTIRPALPDDAEAACAAIRASIETLCGADHAGDPAVLGPWLANKRPEVVRSWVVSNPEGVFVAARAEVIGGAAAVLSDGCVVLNYVAPWARFQGVSRGLLAAVEARAAALGHAECTLTSTLTARAFYRARGYLEAGPPVPSFGGKLAFPMRRVLGRHP